MPTELASSSNTVAALRLPTLSRLPPLTALRAFVVAARHASFARAADELHVSTTAIGQQVRILEGHLGQPLFNRQRGELRLTDAGAALYPGLANAFDTMIDSISDLLRSGSRPRLRMLVCPSLAARWLAPRLGNISQALGDVELSVETTVNGPLGLQQLDDVDCAIVASDERIPGFTYEPLFDDAVIAICAADFASRHQLAGEPERLKRNSIPILHGADPDPVFEWPHWLRANGIHSRIPTTGPRFTHPQVLIEAAAAGHGIALVRHSLVAGDLTTGRLVSPFGTPQPTVNRYHLIASHERRRQPEITSLIAMLREDVPSFATAA
ncbi:LysR substrate-binding domain-containing protein [Agrobacterium tumefaciens]|uniref:LysR substrate-binding domain-containing protein n=1 Tax=Agrobacterium tumefaciens TaxID=358 RepID=UPI0021D3E421|nr:LysR substrate-binding domain-containing protein [Agrobacterium tumefaciens]UXS03573.1 LysR family transcriptional regulator [Agrobacterium tumefaciens]